MPTDLEIMLAPERLDDGEAEERAAFGLLTIATERSVLTEGFDHYISGYRKGPLVSGSHAAEWFAWNWWRLLWEPRSSVPDWDFAHRMTSIGAGYVWPNIAIASDGVMTALISAPSSRPDAKPFRYTEVPPAIIPSAVFAAAVDAFMQQVLGRLDGLGETNLHRLWRDLLIERSDPDLSVRRRLEALLGKDADDDAGDVDRLLADAGWLGQGAIGELAADSANHQGSGSSIWTMDDLSDIARRSGYDASIEDAVRLLDRDFIAGRADVPAWRLGVAMADKLRFQHSLGLEPVDDARLAQMAGATAVALEDTKGADARMSFALDEGDASSRIVLRSKWKVGRRFELARLLGDRLLDFGGALRRCIPVADQQRAS